MFQEYSSVKNEVIYTNSTKTLPEKDLIRD